MKSKYVSNIERLRGSIYVKGALPKKQKRLTLAQKRSLRDSEFAEAVKDAKKYFIDGNRGFTEEIIRRRYTTETIKIDVVQIRNLINALVFEKTGMLNHELAVPRSEEVKHEEVEPEEITLVERLENLRNRRQIEERTVGEQSRIEDGFVYLIVNPAWPKWVKGGMTIDYEDRLAFYNQCDPSGSFSIAAMIWVKARRMIEARLLELLEEQSTGRKGEWFEIDIQEAVCLLRTLDR